MWRGCWFSADCSSGRSSCLLEVWLNQTNANYISPGVVNLWQQSKLVRLFCALVLSDAVMTIIGCVTRCLISAAKVKITWQVVCVTERPLQRCAALECPVRDADRRVASLSRRRETINSKNKARRYKSISEGCHRRIWQTGPVTSHF